MVCIETGAHEPPKAVKEHETYVSCQVPSQSKFIDYYNQLVSNIKKLQSHYLRITAANSIQMLFHNLDSDGTQLHAPLPPSAAHELLIEWMA